MKKVVALLLTALLGAAIVSAPASAGKKKKKPKGPPVIQTQEGKITLPAINVQANGDPTKCWAGLHRRVATISQENGQLNGTVGYLFDIDPKTWNKPFFLEATGGEGPVDFDLYLYQKMPPVEEWGDDPTNAGTAVSVEYTDRAPGGEFGTVPKGTIKAIVCLFGAHPSSGSTDEPRNATFKYTSGLGVKKKK